MEQIKELLQESDFNTTESSFNIRATKDDKLVDVSKLSIGYVVGVRSNNKADSNTYKEKQDAIEAIKRFIC